MKRVSLKKRRGRRIGCLFACMALVFCAMPENVGANTAAILASSGEKTENIIQRSGTGSYSEYLQYYANEAQVTEGSGIRGTLSLHSGADLYPEMGEDALLLREEGDYAEYRVNVPASGLYHIAVSYAQTKNTNRAISIALAINDREPFAEAQEIALPRIYKDAGEIRRDSIGNEVTPLQEPVYSIRNHTLLNTSGYYDGDYSFYLQEGENRIRITGKGMEFILGGIEVTGAAEYSYEDYQKAYPGEDTSGVLIKIQGENAAYKSDSVLYPNYDRVNAATEDSKSSLNNAKYIRINTVGGSLWNTPGQWISWEFEVPESGYYHLGCKFKQNFLDGLFTSRASYIDNEILFSDMSKLKFTYDDTWQVMTFGAENGEPYRIYLEKGVHEIKLMCTMGEFADTLREVNECIYEINNLYRQIIMITSTSPDAYTDYFLTDRVPGLLETMEECSSLLAEEISHITRLTGKRGSKTAVLETLKVQLDTFLDDPDKIAERLSGFKDNISAVGSWLVDIQSQGLVLDYLYVKSPDVDEPKAEAGFLKSMWYSVCRFFASFSDASSGSSEAGKGNRTITVWLNSAGQTSAGRDQAQIIKDLLDEGFTPETGIVVDLQLVQGSLIEATLAGMGPDVALMVGEDQPVNFAVRGALADLAQFSDYKEVLERFYESSVTPFWYEGGLYALPDTQVFNMLFYRTDVFQELGIKAPETWDDFYSILPIIQRNNLQVTVQDMFPALLFQNGGTYYSEDGKYSLLDSQVAIDAMTTYTDLYVKYGFEVKTDFYSRFRSGELVMSVQPYNMYNQLTVAAPEINGLWAMAPIPGIERADGSIDNAQNATVSGSIMLDSCKDKGAAWEFLKWWSRDDVKAKYAVSLEGMLGASARFTPANPGTLAMLAWSEKEVELLMEAWEKVVGIPQLPGSYYTSRGLTNAFRSIVYNGDFPRYAMRLQTKYINEEITRKRREFKLDTR